MISADDYEVGPPREADIGALAELHCAVWRQTYRELMTPESYAGLTPQSFEPVWRNLVGIGGGGLDTHGRLARVAKDNDHAIRFYEHQGFGLDGAEALDQHEGIAELRMQRPSPPRPPRSLDGLGG